MVLSKQIISYATVIFILFVLLNSFKTIQAEENKIIGISKSDTLVPPCNEVAIKLKIQCYGKKKFTIDHMLRSGLYEGEFKNGLRHGKGTFNYCVEAAGVCFKYVGEWKKDRMTGQGTLTYPGDEKILLYKIGIWHFVLH